MVKSKGIRLSMVKAIRAKCADCMNFFRDGKNDCGVTNCSLYFWQPYREQEPDLRWAAKRERSPAQEAASLAGGLRLRALSRHETSGEAS